MRAITATSFRGRRSSSRTASEADVAPVSSIVTLPRRFFAYRDARARRKRLDEAGLSDARDIGTDMSEEELMRLFELALAAPPGASALEIGSYLGASSCYLAAGLAANGGHLYCVDTWRNETMTEGERDTYDEFFANTRRFAHTITPLRTRSADLVETDIATPLSLVFVDGDHAYEAVAGDFEMAGRLLAPEGVIAFHDFAAHHFEGVSRVVGEALATGEWVMAGIVDSLAWIRRARWIEPPWLSGAVSAP
jgi:predicted O-methyltransferase YrrM